MPNDRSNRCFGDCAILVRSTVPPEQCVGRRYIALEHIEEGTLRLLDVGVGEEVSSAKAEFRAGDILFGKLRPYFRKVVRPRFDGVCSTDIWVVRAANETDQGYLYYWMASKEFVEAATRGSTGTKMPRADWDFVSKLMLPVPPLPTQRRIAAILSSLDDKIDLSRSMNRTLEQIAQTLFKSWFIDFDPVRAKAAGDTTAGGLPAHLAALLPDRLVESELGEIPDGWEVQSLDEIADYLNGLACQKYPAVEGKTSLPVIKIRELRQGITENSDRATAEVAAKYIINDGDILFSWSGSLLVTIWCNGRGVLNQHVFKVTSANYPKWYYYHATKHHLEEFQRIAADKATTMGHIQRHHLTNAKLAVPPEKLMLAATEILGSAIDRRINALRQARTLARLRDTLLPKLLSGEVEVSEAEAAVEEVR